MSKTNAKINSKGSKKSQKLTSKSPALSYNKLDAPILLPPCAINEADILRRSGAVIVPAAVTPNPHMVLAGFRVLIENVVARLASKLLDEWNTHMVCLFPREHELSAYTERGVPVQGHRPRWFRGDRAACRPLLVAKPSGVSCMTDCYDMNVQEIYASLPKDGRSEYVVFVTIMDLRGRHQVHTVELEATPEGTTMVREYVPLKDEDGQVQLHVQAPDPGDAAKQAAGKVHLRAGQPITVAKNVEVQVPAKKEVKYFLGVSSRTVKAGSPGVVCFSAATATGSDVQYTTGDGVLELFDQPDGVFQPEGEEFFVSFEARVAQRQGPFYLFTLVFTECDIELPVRRGSLGVLPCGAPVLVDGTGCWYENILRLSVGTDFTNLTSYTNLSRKLSDVLTNYLHSLPPSYRAFEEDIIAAFQEAKTAAFQSERVCSLPAVVSPLKIGVRDAAATKYSWMGPFASVVADLEMAVSKYDMLLTLGHHFVKGMQALYGWFASWFHPTEAEGSLSLLQALKRGLWVARRCVYAFHVANKHVMSGRKTVYDVFVTAATDLLSVALEEVMKRAVPGGSFFLGVYEAAISFARFYEDQPTDDISERVVYVARHLFYGILRVGAHYGLRLLPLGPSILVHYMWNTSMRLWPLALRWFRVFREEVGASAVTGIKDGTDFVFDPATLSVNVHVTSGGCRVPLSQYLEYNDLGPLPSPLKTALVSCSSTRMMATPGTTLSTIGYFIAARLEATVPKPKPGRVVSMVNEFFDALNLMYSLHALGSFAPLDTPEFIEYAQQHPGFSKGKRLWYVGHLTSAHYHEVYYRIERTMTGKSDELLKMKYDRHSGKWTVIVKQRPIFPMEVSQLGLMAFCIPYKKEVLGLPIEWVSNGRHYFFMVVTEGNLSDLEDIINARRNLVGYLALQLGDDSLVLKSDGSGRLKALGSDARSADQTCGLDLHAAIMVEFTHRGLAPVDAETHIKSLTGRVRMNVRTAEGVVELDWFKTKACTNTGSPITSIVAAIGVGAPTFCALTAHSKRVSVDLDGVDLIKLIKSNSKDAGLDIIFEVSSDKFTEVEAISFLGCFLCWNYKLGAYQFVSLNHVKNLVVNMFEDVYPELSEETRLALAAHCASFNPQLFTTPFGAIFKKHAEGLMVKADLDPAFVARCVEKYKEKRNFWQRSKEDWTLRECDEDSFYEFLAINTSLRNIADGPTRYLNFLEDFRNVTEFPCRLEDGNLLFELKYGPLSPLDAECFDPEEHMLSAAHLTRSVFSKIREEVFLNFSTMGHDTARGTQPKKTNATKAVTKAARVKGMEMIVVPEQRRQKGAARSNNTSNQTTEARSKVKKLIKEQAVSGKRLRGGLDAWLRFLAQPFNAPRATCPVNYNPVPSYMVSYFTSKAIFNVALVGTTAHEVTVFGAHTAPARAEQGMDGVSYHSCLQNMGVDGMQIVGPLQGNAGLQQLVAAVSPQLTANQSNDNTASTGNVAIHIDNPAPFKANLSAGGGHVRWKLVSCGVRLINKTPMLSRGGVVRTVIPTTDYQPAGNTQTGFDIFETYTEHDATQDMIEVAWIPRPQDLAYWHAGSNITANQVSSCSSAIMRIWLVADAEAANWEVQLVHHWELSGSELATIGSPTIHVPSDKNIVEPTLDYLTNSTGTARSALSVATQVAEEIGGFVSVAAKVAGPVAAAMRGLASMF